MKCAKCNREEPTPGPDKFGFLFVATTATSTYDPGGVFRDVSTTYQYSGPEVSWFVCDECASKAHDWSGPIGLVISLPLCVLVVFLGGGAALILPGIGLLISGYATMAYWMRERAYKSKYCRDMVLKRVINKLIQRADFIARYGRLEISQTLTRFQRRALQ